MNGWDEQDARDQALAEALEALVAKGFLTPVELGADDQRKWLDCEIASFAENRLGELCDPDELDGGTRQRWLATALGYEEGLPTPQRRTTQACYWILRNGDRAGTLAIARFCLGDFVDVSSVYLRPRHRGKRIMAGTLRAVHAQLEAGDIGMRLETSWTWQPAVRFYLRTGFWLRSWKRDLAFVRPPRTPPPVVTVGSAEATVAVDVDGHETTLARARRDGPRLLEHREVSGLPTSLEHLAHDARTTLALAIALEGWPLIRSKLQWERSWTSDLVHPEALASRIQDWEAWTLGRGWRVQTLRIPGLSHRS